MDSSREIELSDEMIERCQAFGDRLAAEYDRGLWPASLAVSSHGAERNVSLLAQSKMGEVAFALWAGQDPLRAVRWQGGPDSGFDVRLHGYTFDVKTINQGKRFLLWPINKNRFYLDKHFYALVLVKAEPPLFWISHWIDKAAFYCEKAIADGSNGLTTGTWYMQQDRLWSIDQLCEVIKHREAS